MKKIILLSLVLIFSVHAQSHVKTDAMLFGDVKSKESREHIPFANIIVNGTNMGTSADGTGHFKLANLPVGKCIISAHAIGYKSQEKEVIMKRGEMVTLQFELTEDVLEMERVVVTSTRTKHYVKDVPVRTEVITNEEIENKNALNLYEALDNMPGIRVESQCQYCNFTMVRMQGMGAEHTQILINGQPTYSGLAGVYGLQQIGTADIDRIEVVKGAGSALYGSSAVAGAINIVTREPSYEPSTKVAVQFGKYNTNKYDISSSIRNEKGNIGLNIYAQKLIGDAIDETGNGTTRNEVNKSDGISDRIASDLTNAGFNLYINQLFFNNDKLIIRGKSIYEKRQGGTIDDDYYRNPLTDGTESITTSRYESDINYTKPIGINSELNFSIAYTRHHRDATNDSYLADYMVTHNDNVPDLRDMRPYLATENSYTSTLTFFKQMKNHSLLIGIQGFYNDLEESGMYVVVDQDSKYLGTSYRSTSHKSARELGMFIQDEWIVTPSLTFVPGVRIDNHHSSETYLSDKQVFATAAFPETHFEETSVNPRLALKYTLSEKIALRATVGTGFRAPYGFSEDLHLCSGSPRVWKSSDMHPETSVSYNLSADYYGEKLRLSANIFRTDLKDKIGFIDAEDEVAARGYDYQWINIDDAFVQGVEFSINTKLVTNLDLSAGFTLNQGEYNHTREDWVGTRYESDSQYISRFPESTGNLTLEYNPDTWRFTLTGNYQGSMYIDYYNEEINPQIGDQSKIKKTDGFMLFNARVSKTLKQVRIFAGIDNIFSYIQDEKYLDDAAFIYAPLYGTMIYSGVSIEIK